MKRIEENFPVIQSVTKMASSIDLSNERKAIEHLKKIGGEYVDAINSEGYDFEFYDKELKANDKRLIFFYKAGNGDNVHVELTHNWKSGEVKWFVFKGWKTFGKGKSDIKNVVDDVHVVLDDNRDKLTESRSLNELTFDQIFQKYPFAGSKDQTSITPTIKSSALYKANKLIKKPAATKIKRYMGTRGAKIFTGLMKNKFNFYDFADDYIDAYEDAFEYMDSLGGARLKILLKTLNTTVAELRKAERDDDADSVYNFYKSKGLYIDDFIPDLFHFLAEEKLIDIEALPKTGWEEEYIDYDNHSDFDTEWFNRWISSFKLKTEPNTKAEDEMMDKFSDWFDGSSAHVAKYFKKMLPIFKKAKDKYPHIFAPTKQMGSPVFRGVRTLSSSVYATLKKTSKDDWDGPYTFGGEKYYILKKPIKYTPHLDAQSWSEDVNVTIEFGRNLLITAVDDSFILNPNSSHYLSGMEYEESEVIHIGKTFSKGLYLAVPDDDYWDYVGRYAPTPTISIDKAAEKTVGFKPAKKTTKKKTAKKVAKKAVKKTVKKK